jgi:hypothetical protein
VAQAAGQDRRRVRREQDGDIARPRLTGEPVQVAERGSVARLQIDDEEVGPPQGGGPPVGLGEREVGVLDQEAAPAQVQGDEATEDGVVADDQHGRRDSLADDVCPMRRPSHHYRWSKLGTTLLA